MINKWLIYVQGIDASLDNDAGLSGGEMNKLVSLVTCIPNQGMLAPYEKVPIFFRFSPRCVMSTESI